MVPAAAPARKNWRATSCPAPISAIVPYFFASRLSRSALLMVVRELTCLFNSAYSLTSNHGLLGKGFATCTDLAAECHEIRTDNER